MTMIVLDLPMPPSSNNLYRNARGRGRIKSIEYTRWRTYAGCSIPTSLSPLPANMPYSVHINAPINRKRDLGNIEKPLIDLLVAARLVPDDRWCDEIMLRRVTSLHLQVRITVASL